MATPRVELPLDRLAAFCREWGITEFALFGSALREDFGPDSDVDTLVTFAPGRGIGFDNRVEILDELQAIFGREVNLVEKACLHNPFRRRAILKSAEVLYAG